MINPLVRQQKTVFFLFFAVEIIYSSRDQMIFSDEICNHKLSNRREKQHVIDWFWWRRTVRTMKSKYRYMCYIRHRVTPQDRSVGWLLAFDEDDDEDDDEGEGEGEASKESV